MCDVLFDYGADVLAGVEVVNADSLLKNQSKRWNDKYKNNVTKIM